MRFARKVISVILAGALISFLLPFNVRIRDKDNSSIVDVNVNEAHAVVPVAGAAAAFLAELAAASGLTVSELIATIAGVSLVGTGMSIATDAGINYGNTASQNLDNLIDAADYPPWDDLDESSKSIWGTEENYNNAKFNSLLDAFGLGDARDRYYGSGGGSFDYSNSELEIIEKLGRIGSNWINGIGNTVDDILSSFTPTGRTELVNVLGNNYKYINADDYSEWPSNAPREFYVNQGSYFVTTRLVDSDTRRWYVLGTDEPVYTVGYIENGSLKMISFSKDVFTYAQYYGTKNSADATPPSLTTYYTAQYSDSANKPMYYVYHTSSGFSSVETANYKMSNIASGYTEAQWRSACRAVLYGEPLNLGAGTPILGYPENIDSDGDLNVYFPSSGVSPESEWEEFETEPSVVPPVDDDVDLSEIIELLRRFRFTVEYNLLVQDNPLRSAVLEIVSSMNKFSFYAGTGQLKVHDEGVYDGITDLGTLLGGYLQGIQNTLNGFFVTDTAADLIGDLDFPELGDKAADLVDTISSLAPFGALLLMSEMVAILSQTGQINDPSLVWDFDFYPGESYDVVIDLSWLDDLKPVINVFCIVTLLMGLYGVTARLIEMEAAS